MPFINTFEEIGMERGLAKGIEAVLEVRFPAVYNQLMSEIGQDRDHEQLTKILRAATTAASPDELRKLWANGPER